MIAREVTIVWQAQVRVGTATNQKAVVLSERKDAAFVRASCDFQIDLHWGLTIDRQIVKHNFVGIACVKSRATMFEVFTVGDARQKLTVCIERQLRASNSYLEQVRSGAGLDRTRLCLCYHRRLRTVFMFDDLILRLVSRINQQTVIFELLCFRQSAMDQQTKAR